MENTSTVCCMCGDVGFSDKLFQCMRCEHRYQHSYCSNYYDDKRSESSVGVCDWCLIEQRCGGRHKKQAEKDSPAGYSNMDEIKQAGDREAADGSHRGKGTSGASSSKPTGRRYKLLKDVLC